MINPPHPLIGIVLVLMVLLGLMALLKVYAIRTQPHPELVRKLLHIGMGLVILSFPWLFASPWPVFVLATIAVVHLIAVRRVPLLQRRLGGVVDGVERQSWGEVYFPVAVAIVWALSRGDALLFCVPILVLALADAVGALIGVRYGQRRYAVADELKSAEGSLAFFTVAFFSVHIPLLLFTDVGRAEVLLIALTLGLLVMLLEAIAWKGLDNLFIPLGSFILLRNFLKLDADALLVQLGVVLALVIIGLWLRRRTTLDESAMMGAALVGYASWALGGWRWLLPPILMFLIYILLSPRGERDSRGVGIHGLACVTSTGLFWLFLYSSLGPGYYGAYVLAFAAHLAIMGISRLHRDVPWLTLLATTVVVVLVSWLSFFVPFIVIESFSRAAWIHFFLAPVGIAFAALFFAWLQPDLHDCPTDTLRWLRQAAIVGGASTLSLLLSFFLGL